ncbi:MAG: major facilitator superfamily 1 [Aeromicrobium sp.]|nr:major facilitator superfamily 1 [Aeromicrobium sp.]
MPVASDNYKWVVLGVGMFAQASTSTFFQGLGAIGPAIRTQHGLSLGQLGLLLGAPMAGFVVTLLAWGAATDRFDERAVMTIGLAATAAFLLLTSFVTGLWPLCICLGLAGAAGASVNAASGRAVLRWFRRSRRGFAMGLRQTSVPVGAAAAAVILPGLVARGGFGFGMRTLAGICVMGAIASWTWIREPPSIVSHPADVPALDDATETMSARRARRRSFRDVVLAGTALVICQTVFISFVVELLHGYRGMSLRDAGLVFAAAQVGGAGARIAVGVWSDFTPDRLAPLRVMSFAMALGAVALGLAVDGSLVLLVPLSIAVGMCVICWNGLAFTAAGELAAPGKTGTALGLQSTANYLMASVTPFVMGTFIAYAGFGLGFGLIALPAALAGLLLVRTNARKITPTEEDTSRDGHRQV